MSTSMSERKHIGWLSQYQPYEDDRVRVVLKERECDDVCTPKVVICEEGEGAGRVTVSDESGRLGRRVYGNPTDSQ